MSGETASAAPAIGSHGSVTSARATAFQLGAEGRAYGAELARQILAVHGPLAEHELAVAIVLDAGRTIRRAGATYKALGMPSFLISRWQAAAFTELQRRLAQ
jgi:hypothetical protein